MKSNTLSHSLEDYLEAVYIISKDKKVVRVKELAEFLGVKTPSVVDAISKLQEKELLVHEKYGYLELSKKGIDRAKKIYKKHEEIFKFLNLFLGMDEETSEKDACGMEHHVSGKTLGKITYLMEFIETSPEGYPQWLQRFNKFIENSNS